jgi:hypothetical protein
MPSGLIVHVRKAKDLKNSKSTDKCNYKTYIYQAQPLWQTPKTPRASLGQLIWQRFTDVIILDEQMRQADDPKFRDLLRRAREGTITADDVNALNAQMLQSLPHYKGRV